MHTHIYIHKTKVCWIFSKVTKKTHMGLRDKSLTMSFQEKLDFCLLFLKYPAINLCFQTSSPVLELDFLIYYRFFDLLLLSYMQFLPRWTLKKKKKESKKPGWNSILLKSSSSENFHIRTRY